MSAQVALRTATASDDAARVSPPAGAASAAPVDTGALASAVYEGRVRHRRHAPHAHAFSYRVCFLYLDLAELERAFAGRWFWSVDRRNVAEFRRSDYFGDPALPLDVAVRDRVEAETGRRPLGAVRLLTHLRYAGHVFNPVSFYYCFGVDGTLEAVLAEITNTPWRERHAYVLPVVDAARHGNALAWDFDKLFHVSPFLPMACRYGWRLSEPGATLRVHMDVWRDGSDRADPPRREFDATLVLHRRALDGRQLARALWRYPLMTLQVVAAIHWQALRLWWRGNPVYDHPRHGAARGADAAAAPPTREPEDSP